MFDACFTGDEWEGGYASAVVAFKTAKTCEECDEEIPVGEKCVEQEFSEGDENGEPTDPQHVMITCLGCVTVAESLWPHGGCPAGSLWDEIHDQYCGPDEDTDEFACLCPPKKARDS